MRTYRVVHLIDDKRDLRHWAVVSASLRDDETWDVIDVFGSKRQAFAYIGEVQHRQEVIG